ncbi:hypothetical protein [Corynebacterium tapiri]|uniref:Putative oxidoreductase/dehydrogenase Rossmann-like domain-containing protein n=1 Tax=Corynebacterium tapiri TaxID=1448266 RepID=A0A5C4U295_9CORY|nr:hypothetical protein [Corynebacterium tapiri]TNL96042.1 hypothetical protein FHE74_08405 [Corynebacterium tapiri]
MTPPRLRVATYFRPPFPGANDDLALGLDAAGHEVRKLGSLDEAASADCILVTVPGQELAGVVEKLAGHVRPGQIVVHTSLDHGAEALDAVELKGAHVAAMAQVNSALWAVDFLDPAGEAIVNAFAMECHASTIRVQGSLRGPVLNEVLLLNQIPEHLVGELEPEALRQLRLLIAFQEDAFEG